MWYASWIQNVVRQFGSANKYYESNDELEKLIKDMAREDGFTISDIKRQVKEKINIIAAIESFIMTHWNDIQGEEDINEAVTRLSEGTLAYHLSNDEEK